MFCVYCGEHGFSENPYECGIACRMGVEMRAEVRFAAGFSAIEAFAPPSVEVRVFPCPEPYVPAFIGRNVVGQRQESLFAE